MITGIGVDVVGLERFAQKLAATPRLRERLFAESERALPVHSLAARFAAKEALIKALGRSDGLSWTEIEVVPDEHGDPGFVLHGGVPAVVAAHGVSRLHLSLTHDAGVAVAFVVAEGEPGAGRRGAGAAGLTGAAGERTASGPAGEWRADD